MPELEGVAPPGWEHSVRRMKKDKGIDNPYALSWWLKKRGAKPAQDEDAADLVFDAELAAAQTVLQHATLPAVFAAAGRGEAWAHTVLLNPSASLVLAERWR